MAVKQRLSPHIRDMLVERDVAVWDAHHYTTAASSNPGRPNAKDPVSVCLMTPRAPDRMFYGRGPTLDDAVLNALADNTGLNFLEPGITGALARLENELAALTAIWYQDRMQRLCDQFRESGGHAKYGVDWDDDVPF